MNSDLLKNDVRDGKKLKGIMNSLDLKNVIHKPTRIELISQTLIDVILTSDTLKVLQSGTFDPAISDHKLVYAMIELQRNKEKLKIRTVRNCKKHGHKIIQNNIRHYSLVDLNVFQDIDDVVNTWELLYKDVVNEFLMERKAKVKSNLLPWITTEIRKLLNTRYCLLKT